MKRKLKCKNLKTMYDYITWSLCQCLTTLMISKKNQTFITAYYRRLLSKDRHLLITGTDESRNHGRNSIPRLCTSYAPSRRRNSTFPNRCSRHYSRRVQVACTSRRSWDSGPSRVDNASSAFL